MAYYYSNPYNNSWWYKMTVSIGGEVTQIERQARNKKIAKMIAEDEGYTVISVGSRSERTTIPEVIRIGD